MLGRNTKVYQEIVQKTRTENSERKATDIHSRFMSGPQYLNEEQVTWSFLRGSWTASFMQRRSSKIRSSHLSSGYSQLTIVFSKITTQNTLVDKMYIFCTRTSTRQGMLGMHKFSCAMLGLIMPSHSPRE